MRRILIATTLVLLTAMAFTPAAEAQGDPQCMPVYQEYEIGPVKVVRRNTCSVEVYAFGEPILR